MTGPVLVPELAVRDPKAAQESLCAVFGFGASASGGRLRLGGQQVQLCATDTAPGHGSIDHVALAVADIDLALAAALAKGARLDPEVTPDGPLFIPEFWDRGVAYVFLGGPDGARIELCARPGAPPDGLPGHDHIGIACRDLPAMRAFFLGLGFREIAATTLLRDSGNVAVAFLALGPSVVELYQPPAGAAPARAGHWQRLILEGAGPARDIAGPEGVTVLVRP